MNLLIAFGGVLVVSIPLLAVTVTGIAIAVMRRQRHPHVSVLAALGLSALTLNYVGGAAVRVYAQVAASAGQHPMPFVERLLLMDVGLYVLNVAGVALVTWAIFARRGPLPVIARPGAG